MSKIEVNTIEPQSGTTVTIGASGDTITIPTGATLDASNATTTLPSTVVTTTGTQTLTNKTIDASQLTGTITPSAGSVGTSQLADSAVTTAKLADSSVSLAKLTATGTKDSTTFLRGDNTFAAASGGKILQVVGATDSTRRDTTSTSFVTASNTLSVNITPSSTSSKIFLISHFTSLSGANNYYTFYRGATNIGHSSFGLGHSSATQWGVTTICYLDSPSSTSSLTYQVYFRVTGGTGYIVTDQAGGIASITAFEIGA